MSIPIDYESMTSITTKESEHFVAYGKPVFPYRSIISDFFRHLMEFVPSVQHEFLSLPDIQWNRQTCYVYQKRFTVSLPESRNYRAKKYKVSPRSAYFFREFGFIDALIPDCGNKGCYNPYHQKIPIRVLSLSEEEFDSCEISYDIKSLRGKTVAHYLAAVKEQFDDDTLTDMTLVSFIEAGTKIILNDPEKYKSNLDCVLRSGLTNKRSYTDTSLLEMDGVTVDLLQQAIDHARSAGNIDLYVALNDLIRRKK